ncbi:MAG: class III extradiol ring-cleavage dioxygenase [Bdellovibrionales bacterium]
MASGRLPTYFLSHGGGPWPYLTGRFRKAFAKLEASITALPKDLGVTPKAILVVSGHWEEKDFAVTASPKPPMVYDYSGFPAHTYQIKYDAPGSPELAEKIAAILNGVGLRSHTDQGRGFDHGTFVPLAVAYPKADIPVVQLSIRTDYDPLAHFQVGRALAPLRDQGVLIIGSGLSFHNLQMIGPEAAYPSREFDNWLGETMKAQPEERKNRLLKWVEAPFARISHPQEDHFVPLFVAVGAAEGERSYRIYHEDNFMGGIMVSSFRLGENLA